MKFQSGILGVIIVVIALMGTVFGGYILNVNQEFTTTTEYDKLTDVSSLYSYTQQPDSIEYNPAKNFTGYKLSNNTGTGINYTESTTMNQYYMGSETPGIVSMNLSSMISTIPIPSGTSTVYTYAYERVNNSSVNAMYGVESNKATYLPGKAVLLSSFVSYVRSQAPANTDNIVINFPSNCDLNYFVKGNHDYNAPTINDPSITVGRNWYQFDNYGFNFFPTGNNYQIFQYSFFRNYEVSLSFDISSNEYTVNFGGIYSQTLPLTGTDYANNTYIMATSPKACRLDCTLNSYGNVTYSTVGSIFTNPNWHGGNYNVEVVYNSDVVYHYMNPSRGVSINNPSSVVTTDWSNNKTNLSIDIVFGRNNSTNSNTITTPLGDVIYVSYHDGKNYVKVNLGNWIDIGEWENFVLTINGFDGLVTVTPVVDFFNYQSFGLADYVYDIGTITKSPFTKLSWSSTANSYTFSVASTNVRMSEKLLMVNPSLNIRDFFPLEQGYKISMGSFTALGDSFTINGITFYGDADGNPISSTGNLYINNVYYQTGSIKLGNLMIIEDQVSHHTYITDGSFGAITYDLGETTTSTISASGTWFFTNDLYEGKIADKTEYVWDWANELTSTQSIVIWLGLIIICSVIGFRYFNLKILDLAIIVGASVILYSVLGVF